MTMTIIKESIHEKLKLTNFNLSKTGYTKTMKEVTQAEYDAHRRDFPRMKEEDLVADDWHYFRFYTGAVNTGYKEDKYAISPSLKARRTINIGEYYNLNSMDSMTEIDG